MLVKLGFIIIYVSFFAYAEVWTYIRTEYAWCLLAPRFIHCHKVHSFSVCTYSTRTQINPYLAEKYRSLLLFSSFSPLPLLGILSLSRSLSWFRARRFFYIYFFEQQFVKRGREKRRYYILEMERKRKLKRLETERPLHLNLNRVQSSLRLWLIIVFSYRWQIGCIGLFY